MIRTETNDGVRVLTLSRPEKKNALTPEMLEAIRGAIDEAHDARTLLLQGDGSAFCAGFDLAQCLDDAEIWCVLLRGLAEVIGAIRSCPVPVVVGAHGAAIAGGCAIVGAADIAVTDANAKLGYPVVRLGISPAVSAPTLRGAIGDGQARERLLSTELISGTDAFAIGLSHHVVPERADVAPLAATIAASLAAKPDGTLRETKRFLTRLADVDPSMQARALKTSLALVGTEDERRRLTDAWSR